MNMRDLQTGNCVRLFPLLLLLLPLFFLFGPHSWTRNVLEVVQCEKPSRLFKSNNKKRKRGQAMATDPTNGHCQGCCYEQQTFGAQTRPVGGPSESTPHPPSLHPQQLLAAKMDPFHSVRKSLLKFMYLPALDECLCVPYSGPQCTCLSCRLN